MDLPYFCLVKPSQISTKNVLHEIFSKHLDPKRLCLMDLTTIWIGCSLKKQPLPACWNSEAETGLSWEISLHVFIENQITFKTFDWQILLSSFLSGFQQVNSWLARRVAIEMYTKTDTDQSRNTDNLQFNLAASDDWIDFICLELEVSFFYVGEVTLTAPSSPKQSMTGPKIRK